MKKPSDARFDILPETIRNIRTELIRARKSYPTNQRTLAVLDHFIAQLKTELKSDAPAIRIYAAAINAAVMVIRVAEEGDAKFKYASYRQNAGPLFGFPTQDTAERDADFLRAQIDLEDIIQSKKGF
jgi:hypothetical protein